jgi:hypothetical protein
MRVSRATAVFASSLLALLLILVYLQISRKYVRFEHRSAKYHADFAAACDSILASHPLGTNGFVEVSATDGSLPPIVRELGPVRIQVSTNWVWVLVDDSHTDGLVVVWETQSGPEGTKQTNIWNLEIGNGEDGAKPIYVVNR